MDHRSNLLNVAKVAWNRACRRPTTSKSGRSTPPCSSSRAPRFANISVSGINSIGPDTNTPTFVDLKSLQIIDNVAWSAASHNVKTGVELHAP
jgi:hypothetical protein